MIDLVKKRIGLEVHITLNSNKKIFNWKELYSNNEDKPNSKVGPWELGYPGFLPILNPEVIELGIKLSLVLKAKISNFVLFERKIYNYFDLPKGYQITQKNFPIARNGIFKLFLENGKTKKIKINAIQLEEDTAKSIYFEEGVKLDFNRSGNPLLELVTEPVFKEIDEVLSFVKQLQDLLIYLNISKAKMEKGQLRVDLNYSLKIGKNYSTPKYEIKNLNSTKKIKIALEKEIEKHQHFSINEQKPEESSTLSFEKKDKKTKLKRPKKSYFFFPEFNIPPIKIKNSDIRKIETGRLSARRLSAWDFDEA